MNLFFILAFLVVGGTYMFINSEAFLWVTGFTALMLVLLIPLSLFLWYSDSTGLTNIIVGSWEWLGGVHPDGIVQESPKEQQDNGSWWRLLLMLINLPLMFFGAAIVCFMAFGGLGVGAPLAFGGSVVALSNKETKYMYRGMKWLMIGLGGVILGGLFIRFQHWFTGYICTV